MSEPSELLFEVASAVSQVDAERGPPVHPPVELGSRVLAKFFDLMLLVFAPCLVGCALGFIVVNTSGFNSAQVLFAGSMAIGLAFYVLMDLTPRGTPGKRLMHLAPEYGHHPAPFIRRAGWAIFKNLEVPYLFFVILLFHSPDPLIWLGIVFVATKAVGVGVMSMTGGQTWYDRIFAITLVYTDRRTQARAKGAARGFEVILNSPRDEDQDVGVGNDARREDGMGDTGR